MRDDERPTLPLDHEPLNRDERRRAEHGPGGPTGVTGSTDPDSANPAAHRAGDDAASYTGRPDQDVTRRTGTGTGGATEDDDRVTNHPGIHLPNRPNG